MAASLQIERGTHSGCDMKWLWTEFKEMKIIKIQNQLTSWTSGSSSGSSSSSSSVSTSSSSSVRSARELDLIRVVHQTSLGRPLSLCLYCLSMPEQHSSSKIPSLIVGHFVPFAGMLSTYDMISFGSYTDYILHGTDSLYQRAGVREGCKKRKKKKNRVIFDTFLFSCF